MSKVKFVAVLCFLGLASLLVGQTALTNDDLVKLAGSGLSQDFILRLIEQQPANFITDAGRLVTWKNSGVSERIILAAVKKCPPKEPLTSSGLMQLVQAKFSEDFLLNMLNTAPVLISTDTANLVNLKQAGLSERVLSVIVNKGVSKVLPSGTEVVVRLIDGIDSEKNNAGDTFHASLEDPIQLGNEVIAPKGADAIVKLVLDQESGKLTGRTELTLALASVDIGGTQVPINTTSVSQTSSSRGQRTAKVAAGGAALGAIIGAIAGGGKGAAIGAGAGAAAGAGSQVFMKGQRVQVPSETLLTFTTQEPLKIQ